MGRKAGEKIGLLSCHGMGGNQASPIGFSDQIGVIYLYRGTERVKNSLREHRLLQNMTVVVHFFSPVSPLKVYDDDDYYY